MANVLIVAYLLIVLALIAVILLQRSEGGALGIGGGTGGGLVSARSSANLLTRTTAILAALFMAIAIALTIVAELDRTTSSILDKAEQGSVQALPPAENALNSLTSGAGAPASGPASDTGQGSNTAPADGATPVAPAEQAPVTSPATPAGDAPSLALPVPAN